MSEGRNKRTTNDLDLEVGEIVEIINIIKERGRDLFSLEKLPEAHSDLDLVIKILEKVKTYTGREINGTNPLNTKIDHPSSDIASAPIYARLYEKIGELSKNGILAISNNIIQYVNPALMKLLGYNDSGELVGNNAKIILPTDSLSSLQEPIQKSGIENVKRKFVFRHIDGSYIVANVVISRTKQKDTTAFVLLLQDVVRPIFNNKTSYEQLKFLLKESPTILYTATHTLPITATYMSENAEKIMGFKVEEISTPEFFETHIHPHDAQAVFLTFNKVFEQGYQKMEYRFLFADGTYHWIYDHFLLTYDESGEINGIVGSLTDITPQKLIEKQLSNLVAETQSVNEELRASDEELRNNLNITLELNEKLYLSEEFNKLIISNMEEGIIVLDSNLNYQLINPFMEKLIGKKSTDVTGKNCFETLPVLKEGTTLALLNDALGGKPGILKDTYFNIANTDGFWFTTTYSPFKNSQGKIEGVIVTITDNTERKRYLEKLEDQKNLLNSFFEAANFNMSVLELKKNDFIYRMSNNHMASYMGITVEELVGKSARELNLPEQVIADWVSFIKETIIKGSLQIKEYLFTAPGKETWYYVSNSRINSTTVSSITIDITERKKAEERINESEQRWQFALEGSNEGVWDWNMQTNKVFFSRKCKELLGYREDEEVNELNHWKSKIHPEHEALVFSTLNDYLLNESEFFRVEYKALVKKNEYIWALVRGKVVEKDSTGKPMRMIGTMTDTSQRKQYEEKLSNLAAYLDKIINSIIDPIFVKDDQHTWVLINDACCEYFQIRREQIIGKTDSELFPKSTADDMREMEQLVLKTGQDCIKEELIIKPDGKKHTIIVKKSLCVAANGQRFIVGIFMDVTEQKDWERKIKEQNENLKKINSELDSFVYRTSHDLRSPLTSVLGLIDISRIEKDEAVRQSYLDLMEKSISKLDNFIQDILNFARNSRVEIAEEEINISSLIQDVFENLKFMEGYDTMEKRVEVAQNVPFFSDVFRLKIIFNNLISNAIKYGTTQPQKSYLLIKAEVNERNAIFKFIDNGRGIPNENKERIFDMFYRASSTSKGSGLGLYIVKEVVQTLQGEISVQSEPGIGTTFVVELPNVIKNKG